MSYPVYLNHPSFSAPEYWDQKAAYTISNNSIYISIHQNHPHFLRELQITARKIQSLPISQFILAGENWDFETQWAFFLGFDHPKSKQILNFEKTDQKLLDQINTAKWLKDLINQGPNKIYPYTLTREIDKKLKSLSSHINSQFIDGDDLLKQGYVGTHAVGRGSAQAPSIGIYDYNPTGDPNTPVHTCLVGKGVSFDAGGYSIKASDVMSYMKFDMGGAATVAAALVHAIQNNCQKRIKLIICSAENLVSSNAYKLGDVLKFKNGQTVEILNTDAEGRLCLADGLLIADESKPKYILDAATLTGAICIALAHEYTGLFTMDNHLAENLLSQGNKSNDPLWRMPLSTWHQDNLPSPFADTANSGATKGGGYGGSSNAAGFLSRFIQNPESNWAHLDIAGTGYLEKGNNLWAPGATAKVFTVVGEFLLK